MIARSRAAITSILTDLLLRMLPVVWTSSRGSLKINSMLRTRREPTERWSWKASEKRSSASSSSVARGDNLARCMLRDGGAPATLVQRATARLEERGGGARFPYPPPLLPPSLPAIVAASKQGGKEGPCALLSPWREELRRDREDAALVPNTPARTASRRYA
eukprot:scaffold11660_cov119-Isochrysis_galbana.AAC.3